MADGVGLLDLLPKNKPIVGVEIGCRLGDTSIFLLEKFPDLFLFGVDPYLPYVDWNGDVSTEIGQERVLDKFLSRVSVYSDRFKLFKLTSDEAVTEFEDGSLDFIFIDGLHTFDQVLLDCRNYYPKIKSGGIFSGHDYRTIKAVRKAVDMFAGEVKISEIKSTSNDVWYWVKP